MDVCWVRFALDDVEDGDVARFLVGRHGDHSVFGLEETSHYVKDCGFADGLCCIDI